MSGTLERNSHWGGGSYIAADGYRYVRVACENGRTRYRLEHRLVMERLIGRPLRRDEHVHHRNGIRSDNREENLELLHITEHGRLHSGHGKTWKRAHGRIDIYDVRAIRRSLANGIQQQVLARLYGLKQTSISEIGRRKTWADVN